jgi:cysteine synthase A
MKIAKDATHLIGNTPLVWLRRVTANAPARVAAKLEYFNPMASVKDRIAVSMIDQAQAEGKIGPNTVIVEPTSGNTGIGLAFVAAVRGLKLILFMPETFSIERRNIMKALGAGLMLTPGKDGMPGAIKAAEEYCAANPDTFMPQQFQNPANPDIHRRTTGPEIWQDTGGQVDILVCGVGTGGTLTGAGEFLKSQNPGIKIIAVEPGASPVLSGGTRGPHAIQGIGAGFIPGVLNMSLIDEVVRIPDQEALDMTRRLATEEGLYAGISAGAAAAAAVQVAQRPANNGKLIVTVFPDSADRYPAL